MKLCVDCKHFQYQFTPRGRAHSAEHGLCTRRRSPVDGRELKILAETERSFSNPTHCGPNGQYFEPKENA